MTSDRQATSNGNQGRMLLSHNFNLTNNELPALSRAEFAQIFIDGLINQANINAKLIENPHWTVEIIFANTEFTATEVGQICSQILVAKRQTQQTESPTKTDTLFLGGKKTTPAMSSSPTSLQTGEWGVDVVETLSAQNFLDGLQWDVVTASKPADGIFKVEFLGK